MGPFCNKKTNCFLSNLTWQTSKDSFPIFPYSQTVRTESVEWRTGTAVLFYIMFSPLQHLADHSVPPRNVVNATAR